MTFYTGNTTLTGNLAVSKKVINLTTKNLNWQNSVSAKPLDILSFVITLQTGNQQINNIFVKDILPQNLIYKGNLTLNADLNSSEDLEDGISIDAMEPNSIYVISYQAQVAPAGNFSFGETTLSNTATITGSEIGTDSVSANVIVNNSNISGATSVPTGSASNYLPFLTIMLVATGIYLYFSGKTDKFLNWIQK